MTKEELEKYENAAKALHGLAEAFAQLPTVDGRGFYELFSLTERSVLACVEASKEENWCITPSEFSDKFDCKGYAEFFTRALTGETEA